MEENACLPLFKNAGKPHQISSYRPISLCCSLSKIFEKLLLFQIEDHSRSMNLLSAHQHGFRKSYSTVTNLLSTYDFVGKHLDNHDSVDVIYLDFRKAFDKLSHKLLITKLSNMKFSNTILNWLSNFLSDRTQAVVINGSISNPIRVASGVPQGSLLGPILFLLYLNDIFELKLNANLIAFADDTKIYDVVSQLKNLSSDLLMIEEWCIRNEMELNVEKCAVIHFDPHNPISSYYLNDVLIPVVDHYKDLGIIIDSHLSFSTHVSFLVKKCIALIRVISKSFACK